MKGLHCSNLCLQDVAIAYGYNNMAREIPGTSTFGREVPLNQLSEAVRGEIRGFTESLTWALCSRAENFDRLRRPHGPESAVSVGNPATAEFEVCRTSLLPGEGPRTLTSESHRAQSGMTAQMAMKYVIPAAQGGIRLS